MAFHPVKKMYTFNSPGVPKKVNDRFNKRTKPCKLVIRRSQYGDIVDKAGDCHLGHMAKDNVSISYISYRQDKKKGKTVLKKINPHTIVFSEHAQSLSLFGFGGDLSLNNLARSSFENFRWLVGGFVLSPFFFSNPKSRQKGVFIIFSNIKWS